MDGAKLPSLLVLTTVHGADDTRIREKLIRSLTGTAAVSYATRAPAPTDMSGLAEWIRLRGGRLRRNGRALTLLFSRRFKVAVVHDPELLPAAILAAVVARRRVVVDVHEHIPAQLRTKEWLPSLLRGPAAWVAGRLLRIAERVCDITLAEPGYQVLFRHPQRVFANYPEALPSPTAGDGSIVYVGDVTEARGLTDLMAAVALMEDRPLVRIVGRCDPELANRLSQTPGVEVLGRIPHPEAMRVVRDATVGVSPLRDTPNYRYSLPTKVVEYLGSGIAVVASDLPGTREVIAGLPGVALVPPEDPVGLAAALTNALADPAIRAAAAANVPSVRAQFRWPRDEVAAFYHGLLGNS